MKLLFENWQKFLNEEEVIDEATESEISNLDGILHNLNPRDLSFNNIFGDRMRIIEPMKVKDKNLQRLKDLLRRNGYEADFKTGLATYYTLTLPAKEGERPTSMMLGPKQIKGLFNDEGELDRKNYSRSSDEEFEKIKKHFRKKQIKIGKLLQKGSRLLSKAKTEQKDFEEVKPEDFDISPDESKPEDEVNIEKYRTASQKAEGKVDQTLKQFNDSFQQLNVKTYELPQIDDFFSELGEWWNKKSTFYRENPEDAGETDSAYSIVYTRHPIDVMRMADFENIETCHSPPSRGSDNSYYKCAVAEAYGHGPVAYVVRNEDVDAIRQSIEADGDEELTRQEVLDFIENKDDEFFTDNERGTGYIAPVSRQRIKKLSNPPLGIMLAAPSTMTYGGKRFPELYNNISDFLKAKQESEIKKLEDARDEEDVFIDGKLNMANWVRFGGDYEDAGDNANVAMATWLDISTTGLSHWDSTTQDNLDMAGTQEELQGQVNNIRDRYNRNYQSARITRADVEDDGAGEYYIDVHAELRIVLSEGDFVKSAFQDSVRKSIEHLPAELKEMGYDELEDYVNYTTLNPRSQDWADLLRQIDDQEKTQIVIEIPISIENVNPEGGGYAYSVDNFQSIASAIDSLDDKAEQILELAKGYLKREGVLEGGELITFARALEDESWYEWDYNVDDDYAPTSIELETATYVNFEDLIQKIPITFERKAPNSPEVYINFAGDPLALASQTHGGEDYSFKGWEVRSPEFEADRLGGFKDLDEVKLYVKDQVAKLILRPKGSKTPRGLQSSRDYLIAVSNLMREAAGGEADGFAYPYRTMWANGPDSDDEYKMMFGMNLDDDTPDEVVENAHKIIAETDDEDQLKDIFRAAFAKVAKIPGENLAEAKNYFRKFDFF